MKILHILLILLMAVALAGCVTVQKVVKERVDQEKSGNMGYISGESRGGEPSSPSTTREYIDIRVEVPEWAPNFGKDISEQPAAKAAEPQRKKVSRPAEGPYEPKPQAVKAQKPKTVYIPPKTQEITEGNQGYISKSNVAEHARKQEAEVARPAAPRQVYRPETKPAPAPAAAAPVLTKETSRQTPATTALVATKYTVKDGDTLGHIAKKFYNKSSKWTVIYEANMDKIDDPARIKPGIVLAIPALSTEAKEDYFK